MVVVSLQLTISFKKAVKAKRKQFTILKCGHCYKDNIQIHPSYNY